MIDSRPLQEGAAVPSVASCQGDRDNLGLGRLVLNREFKKRGRQR